MGYLNIKITARFFRDYSLLRDESQTQFADLLQEKCQLFDLVFDELKNYMNTVRKKVAATIDNAKAENKVLNMEELSDRVYCDLFAHSDQLTERMNFIKDFVKYGTFTL